MTTGREVSIAIEGAHQAIATANALIAEGKPIDLTGLDEGVARICSAIAALPRTARLDFKPQVLALIDGLNRLVGLIEQQHGEMAAALNGVASRRTAVNAYGKGADAGGAEPGLGPGKPSKGGPPSDR